jgi:hypothetical protein
LKASELERERRSGRGGQEKYPKMIEEHPVFMINNKTNSLLMSKREKLRTVREKNAEELIKQGKKWERDRLMAVEQERINEVETRKEREQMLEDHTLYIFDPNKVEMNSSELLRIKSRKFTECEIDLKDFLLSEKDNMKTRVGTRGTLTSEDSKKTDTKSQEIESFDEKNGPDALDAVDKGPSESELELQKKAEEMKKKKQEGKKDEDPRITRFKNAEVSRVLHLNALLLI